ncbi:capsid protein [Hubei noda-like virus 8]|uniref:capsid protein n=1 Tax=Hubei noda-like virus 8 TaxID=1922988 RepID=UPI00090A9FEB|nr:capsid protein [Hubei noda-like virus 8]APG76554.1 capsid protein [Hubei noda-like virus 8]
MPQQQNNTPALNVNLNTNGRPSRSRSRKKRSKRSQSRSASNVIRNRVMLGKNYTGNPLPGDVLFALPPNATRSGFKPNPADPRTFDAFTNLGNTSTGRAAAQKILHPCEEGAQPFVRFPDGAASITTAFERRDEYMISRQYTADSNMNILVVHLPFLRYNRLVIQWDSSQSPTDYDLQTVFTEALTGVAIYPSWNTKTTGDTSDQITYYTTILSPNVLTPGGGGTPEAARSYLRNVRRVYYGSTQDLDASSLYDEGRVVAGQWSPDVVLGINRARDNTVQNSCYRLSVPALTSESIVQSDAYRYQALAKTGCYMPLRPSDPDVQFSGASEQRPLEIAFHQSGNITGNLTTVDDIWLRGWNIGVELWTNIDYRANLRYKTCEGLELSPSANSLYSTFEGRGYPRDDRALSVIREFARSQPHAYPADFNDKNLLWGQLIRGLGTALSSLGLPILSQVAEPVAHAIANYVER